MNRPGAIGERTLALFFLGLLLFNPPLLSIFSVDRFLADVPLLYLYLFVAWGGFIVLVGSTAALGRSLQSQSGKAPEAPSERAGTE